MKINVFNAKIPWFFKTNSVFSLKVKSRTASTTLQKGDAYFAKRSSTYKREHVMPIHRIYYVKVTTKRRTNAEVVRKTI
jgi:hypothetical protein